MDPFLLIMIIAMIAMMWFTSSRQRRAVREREEFRASLVPGARVMTSSGLYGTVVSIDDEAGTVVLDSGAGPMTWSRDAIAKRVDSPVDSTLADSANLAASAPLAAAQLSTAFDEEVRMPEIIDETPWVPVGEATETVETVDAVPVEAVEEVPVEYAEGEYVEGGPIRPKESLEELAEEGPMDWPDDGSRAKHQRYIDGDKSDWELKHDAPVERDGEPSLALAEEWAMRADQIL